MCKKVISLILALGMLLSLAACSSSSPEDTVRQGLDALKNLDQETVNQVFESGDSSVSDLSLDSEDETSQEINKQVFGALTYKITGSNVDGDTATVTTEITTKDMSTIFSDLMQEAMSLYMQQGGQASSEDLQQQLVDTMKEKLSSAGTATNTVDITVNKDSEGQWKIAMDQDLANALTGGMINAITQMGQSMTQGVTE